MGLKDTTRRKLGEHLEMLPVKLSESELLERAKKVGCVNHELEEHQLEADAVRKRLKAKEAELSEERQKLANILFTGAEPRETKVEAWANFVTGKFEEIRSDTAEVINRRPLLAHERQGEFDRELWAEQLHLRLVKEQEEVARRRAGDFEKDDENP